MGEIIFGFLMVVVLGTVMIISYDGVAEFKKEAYQRGHMVECLGKSGYYWECE